MPDAKDIRFLGGVLFPGLASRHSRTAPVAPSDDSTTRSIALIVTAPLGQEDGHQQLNSCPIYG